LAARLEAEAADKVYMPDPANPHAKLQASIFNQRSKEYNFTLENYDQTINQLKIQIDSDNARAKYYRQRLGIAAKVEGLRQRLQEMEAGTLLNTLTAMDSRLNIEGLLAQAESDAAQATRKMAAQRAERESFIQHWNAQNSQDLADTRRRLVQAQQDYAKASLHNELVVLTAPRDAVVLSVAKVSVGSVVTSAEPLIHLVPIDEPLSVEADISGIDSGYVRPGDEVTIKFDTLPYLQYGSGRGVVRSISADSFNPETTAQEGGTSLPHRPSTLYYKGDIALDKLMLHDTPPGFRLMPGMPVTADVKVGTRSVLGYFIAKILPVAYESMREP
jgi:HlyD family secretion protein